MIKIIALTTFVALNSGCGFVAHQRAQAALGEQMDADAAACRQGSQTACEAYRIDVQRCGPFTSDPVCRANP